MRNVKSLHRLMQKVATMAVVAAALAVIASCQTGKPDKVEHISMLELSKLLRRPVSQPVVLDFFFNACEACQQNEPDLEGLVEELDGVAIFAAVSVDCDLTEVAKWRKKFPNAVYDILDGCDTKSRLIELFEIEGYPTTVVIDRNGDVIEKTLGLLSLLNLDLVHFTAHTNRDSIKSAVVRAHTP